MLQTWKVAVPYGAFLTFSLNGSDSQLLNNHPVDANSLVESMEGLLNVAESPPILASIRHFHALHLPRFLHFPTLYAPLPKRLLHPRKDHPRLKECLGHDCMLSSSPTQIRIVHAPRVKMIQGCIDIFYPPPATIEGGKALGVSNATAHNFLVNGFLEVGRARLAALEVGSSLVGGSVPKPRCYVAVGCELLGGSCIDYRRYSRSP